MKATDRTIRPVTVVRHEEGELVEEDHRSPLLVGVLLPGNRGVASWKVKLIDQLYTARWGNIPLIISCTVPLNGNEGKRALGSRILRLLEAVEDRFFGEKGRKSYDAGFLATKVKAHLSDVNLMSCSMGFGLHADDVEAIKALSLDLVVNLGVPLHHEELAHLARLGWLQVRYNTETEGHNYPLLFWSLYDGDPLVRVCAELISNDETAPRVLCSSLTALEYKHRLLANQEDVFSRASSLLLRGIRLLYEKKAAQTYAESEPHGRLQLEKMPSALQAVRFAARGGVSAIYNRVQKVVKRTDQWFIAYRTDPKIFYRTTGGFTPQGFRLLVPPPSRFYADPFPFSYEGIDHLFFEDYIYSKKKAVISWCYLRPDGTLSQPEVVLEGRHHFSYPFVFEYDSGIYMIPETAKKKTVEMYQAVNFPHEWKLVKTLFSGVSAVDATLHYEDGRYWMFLNLGEYGSSTYDELFLYYSDTPFGPWQAHASNPVKTDVRSARPAGRLFRSQGQLLRPAQDCSESYGCGLKVCRVEKLTESEYKESVIDHLGPGWLAGNKAFHTLNSSDQLEVIDGQKSRWRWF